MEQPNIWVHCEDEQGRSYFYNTITQQSTWELPDGDNDWLECDDTKTDKKFFHNPKRDISTWTHPADETQDAWLECIDKDTGRAFYYNIEEDRSVWVKPQKNQKHENNDIQQEQEETKDRSDSQGSYIDGSAPDGEYHDYVLKEGGGTTVFGRKSWKRRFMVLKHGELGWFTSYKDYASGTPPLKGRWINLDLYRLEEMLNDTTGLRLLPLSEDAGDRVWNLRCDDEQKKRKLMDAFAPFVSSKGFVKHLDRHLSGRRFLQDFSN